VNMIVDSGARTKADLLAVEFVMSQGDVENLANLPHGWFTQKQAEIVQLKPDAGRSSSRAANAGVVLPSGRK
jgi:hypothetical protein